MATYVNAPIVLTNPPSQGATNTNNNFQALNDSFVINHVNLTNVTGIRGWHTKLLFPASVAEPTIGNTQCGIYPVADSTNANIMNLYFKNISGILPLAGVTVESIAIPAAGNITSGTLYKATFSNGISIRFGSYVSSSTSTTLTYPTTPVDYRLTSVFAGFATTFSPGAAINTNISANSPTGFSMVTTTNTVTRYFLIIGQ